MAALLSNKVFLVLAGLLVVMVCIGAVNYALIKYRGTPVPVPDIPRGAETYGTGTPLSYVVLGDSTTVSQGGDYDQGYVRETARHIASTGYAVTLHNFGISGARARDVLTEQLPQAVDVKPDVALIAVTANDVTHFTGYADAARSVGQTIDGLRAANPDVKVIVTGSPQMGAVPRFPEPARSLAGYRTNRMNNHIAAFAGQKDVVFAPIAARTGPIFDARPELYASDLFHPNTEGYTLWTPVINEALDQALEGN